VVSDLDYQYEGELDLDLLAEVYEEVDPKGGWRAEREPALGWWVVAGNSQIAVIGDQEGDEEIANYIATFSPAVINVLMRSAKGWAEYGFNQAERAMAAEAQVKKLEGRLRDIAQAHKGEVVE
jgi:hypothetical protein